MPYKSSNSKFPIPNSQGIRLGRIFLELGSWDLELGTWFLGLLLLFSLHGLCNTPTALLDSASTSYSKGDYEKASQHYEKIISIGYESPEIYFNLGNCYYKLNEIGKSVLNYERAKELSPYDEDINYNLKQVNQRTIDKIEPSPKLFLEEWWENLVSIYSEKTWGMLSVICFVLFLFFLGLFIIASKPLNKQIGFWLSLVFFVFTSISFFISKSRYDTIVNKNSAVILSPSAEIKNSPSDLGTKLFILHEGTKVSVIETNNEWVNIKLTSEKTGWVKKSDIEYI